MPTREELLGAFEHFDTDSSGEIDEDELYQLLTTLNVLSEAKPVVGVLPIKKAGNTLKEQCHYIFKRFDIDRNGGISLAEVRHLARGVGVGR